MPKNKKKTKPTPKKTSNISVRKRVYLPGQILVTTTDNGRQKNLFFYQVISLTEGKAPRVKSLEVDTFQGRVTETYGYSIVKPIANRFKTDKILNMRWIKKGFYITSEFKEFIKNRTITVFTEIYDPRESYKTEWYCD